MIKDQKKKKLEFGLELRSHHSPLQNIDIDIFGGNGEKIDISFLFN